MAHEPKRLSRARFIPLRASNARDRERDQRAFFRHGQFQPVAAQHVVDNRVGGPRALKKRKKLFRLVRVLRDVVDVVHRRGLVFVLDTLLTLDRALLRLHQVVVPQRAVLVVVSVPNDGGEPAEHQHLRDVQLRHSVVRILALELVGG